MLTFEQMESLRVLPTLRLFLRTCNCSCKEKGRPQREDTTSHWSHRASRPSRNSRTRCASRRSRSAGTTPSLSSPATFNLSNVCSTRGSSIHTNGQLITSVMVMGNYGESRLQVVITISGCVCFYFHSCYAGVIRACAQQHKADLFDSMRKYTMLHRYGWLYLILQLHNLQAQLLLYPMEKIQARLQMALLPLQT